MLELYAESFEKISLENWIFNKLENYWCGHQQTYIFIWFPDTSSNNSGKTKISWFEAEKLVVTGETNFFSWLSQKERTLKQIEKNAYIVNYWSTKLCLCHYVYSTILVITMICIFLLLYFTFVIDNLKPTSLDCVNNNIYSCILSLLNCTETFWFMH